MRKKNKITHFDPNGPAAGEKNIFGLPFNTENASVVLIPVPWDVTVSYGDGASKGPRAILDASIQVDLFDPFVKESWKIGVAMERISQKIVKKNYFLRKMASRYIANIEKGISGDSPAMKRSAFHIDKGCDELRIWVKETAKKYLNNNKLVGLVGGEHSVSLGFIQALAEKNSGFGILQIDAHCDLRKAYEGLEYSHASVMYNALKIQQVKKLVQVGIRDWCQEEDDYIRASDGRVRTFFDHRIKNEMYEGRTWKSVCDEIISCLPQKIYLSFDIDGLDPKLCPNTGTPVPGGLDFEQAVYLIMHVVRSGKTIIGFDLNEVVPGKNQWDGNVGARILFKMCNLTAVSNGLASFCI